MCQMGYLIGFLRARLLHKCGLVTEKHRFRKNIQVQAREKNTRSAADDATTALTLPRPDWTVMDDRSNRLIGCVKASATARPECT